MVFGLLRRWRSNDDTDDAIVALNRRIEEKDDLVSSVDAAYERLDDAIQEYESTPSETTTDRIGTALCDVRDALEALERHLDETIAMIEDEFGHPHERKLPIELDKLHTELTMERDTIRRDLTGIRTDRNAFEDDVDAYLRMREKLNTDDDATFVALAGDPDVMKYLEKYKPEDADRSSQ